MSPRYEHDCEHCVFLGAHEEFDLYFHDGGEQPFFTTLVARFGECGDYLSGLAFSRPFAGIDGQQRDPIPALAEARRLAIEAGHGAAISKATGEPQ